MYFTSTIVYTALSVVL